MRKEVDEGEEVDEEEEVEIDEKEETCSKLLSEPKVYKPNELLLNNEGAPTCRSPSAFRQPG